MKYLTTENKLNHYTVGNDRNTLIKLSKKGYQNKFGMIDQIENQCKLHKSF